MRHIGINLGVDGDGSTANSENDTKQSTNSSESAHHFFITICAASGNVGMEVSMNFLRILVKTIDKISEKAGAVGKWFAVILVLVGTYETISRHFFGSPTIWAYDSLSMAGGVLYMIGASYTHLHNSHTRVDIIYSILSKRKQAMIDVISSLIFFFPLMTVMFKLAVTWSIKAVKVKEVMFNSFWYPPAAPYRIIFALGILLLLLQGAANFIRDLHFLIRGKQLD